METELRARKVENLKRKSELLTLISEAMWESTGSRIEWDKVDHKTKDNLLALLKPKLPAYDSPEGWWLRLSGEQREHLCKRYPEMGGACSSVPDSGADEHATVEPVVVTHEDGALVWIPEAMTVGQPYAAVFEGVPVVAIKNDSGGVDFYHADTPRENAEPVAWREKFFHADCTLDGICGVVEECCEAIKNTPKDERNNPIWRDLLEDVLSKLHTGLLEVEREYTNADASPPREGMSHEGITMLLTSALLNGEIVYSIKEATKRAEELANRILADTSPREGRDHLAMEELRAGEVYKLVKREGGMWYAFRTLTFCHADDPTDAVLNGKKAEVDALAILAGDER